MEPAVICQGVDGPCDNGPKLRRQNTQYKDDTKNWVLMCDSCFEENEIELNAMWAEMGE